MFRYEAGRDTPLSDAQILYGFAMGRLGGKEPPRVIKVPKGLFQRILERILSYLQ
jgi:hypothetical protein